LPLCLANMPNDQQLVDHWLESPLGTAVLERESALMEQVLSDVFGFQLVQVGQWGCAGRLTEAARTQHRSWLSPRANGPGAIRAEYHLLPIATSSVEAVVLPHTLEYAPHPHEMLREVERVLVGEGYLIICGFNPRGPWGARHLMSRGRFPSCAARLMSERRTRDWLRLLGFEVVHAQRYLFTPPWTQSLPGRSGPWLEQRGPMVASPLAGAYLLKARKQVHAMTAIRLAFPRRARVVVGAVKPTSRNAA